MDEDWIFHALANMGNASHLISWANNCLEDVVEVSEEIKAEMKQVNVEIHRLQEQLREVRKRMNTV